MVAHHRGASAWPARRRDAPDPADLASVRAFLTRDTGRPTAIDVFCGPGGLSLGLQRAGFDVLVGADSERWAVRTHEANVGGLGWCGDLSSTTDFLDELRAWGVGTIDLLAGGVPCQPFSRAGGSRIRDLVENGGRAAHDHRADLWSSFVGLVEALRPAAVLVENVPDLPRWDDGAVLIGLYESLRGLGYQVEARILDGFRYGVPQHRQRLILIGLDGNRRPRWPEPSDELVSLRDAIGDLPPIPRAQRHERLPYDARRQTSSYQRLMRSTVPPEERHVILDHVSRDVRPDDMEAFRLLGEGQTYIDLPERLRRYRSDVFTDKYKRLSWHELCRTITAHIAKDGYWYIHPDQHRTLSIREAARVQSFPDDFRFAGAASHRYRQIGNAVPVLLGEAIGRSLLEGLQTERRVKPDRTHEGFRQRLIAWRTASTAWSPPWRAVEDPWLVLVGELLLTRARPRDAEQMFDCLRRIAPDPGTLTRLRDAPVRLGDVGVGDRAQTLIDIAHALMAGHGGLVPDDEVELRALPGVGEGVCGAVLTFGFGRRQILLDRTTARVAGRLARHDDSRRFQLRLDLHRLAGAAGPDADFNRALLDLGRELCLIEDPRCRECPLAAHCATGRATEREGESPRVADSQPELVTA
jgi:DNA (cytosine-5)-methyltransferase 1